MRRLFKVFALLIFTAAQLSAQDHSAWSLEDCIKYATENNISLKRQKLTVGIKKKDFQQSKLNLLPDLYGQVEHNIGSGRVLDRGTYEWVNTDVRQGDLGVVSNISLFQGLRGYNTIKVAEADYNVSRSNLELYRNNIVLLVMTGYLDMLLKEELYEIAVEKVKVTELQVERMEKLLEVGNASKGELLEVKAQASRENYNLTLARNEMEVSKLNLVQLLNLQDYDSFEIERPDIEDPSALQIKDLETVYAAAVSHLPQIKAAEYTIDYNKKNLDITKGALSPELYVRALYYSNYSDKLINPRDPANPLLDYPVPQQVMDNQYRQVSVGLSIPVFNKWQNLTNISKAKINLQDSKYQLENEKQQLFKEIQQYHADARAALDNYLSACETFTNSEEAYRYTEERFKVGTATALELEESRNNLFAARTEQANAKFVFVFYVKILDFYQGRDITFP
ncbi:MAG: TolC family protein [Bacteroidales bacterium]|nr:TolC family protein [Bacteroidales bacterium]